LYQQKVPVDAHGEAPRDLPAVGSPPEDQPTTEDPFYRPEASRDLIIILSVIEAPSKTRPARESLITLPQLESPSED